MQTMKPKVSMNTALLAFTALNALLLSDARVAVLPEEIVRPTDGIEENFLDKAGDVDQFAEVWNTTINELTSYEHKRYDLILEEELFSTGGHLVLTDKELKVHQILMHHKLTELSEGFRDPTINAAALHFFKGKPLIEKSKVFEFVKKMPKGAVLHLHNTAAVSSEWVIRNLTYMPGMMMCYNHDGLAIFTFRTNATYLRCRTDLVEIQEERENMKSETRYNELLESKINLKTPLPELHYTSSSQVWDKFNHMFTTMGDAIKYVPAFKAFHYRMMEELFLDNIMYAEIRMRFKKLYDDDGVVVSEEESIKVLMDVVESFKSTHEGFLGIKVIYALYRGTNRKNLFQVIEKFTKWHNMYPDFIVGFDLVGKEDSGHPLHHFIDILQSLPKTAKYFFHAGETNLYGASTDLNLLDAVLLNTTRIGHGFALLKHPAIAKVVKERKIGIEVSPISNQVLHLVGDLRNHPGGFFISQDIPMVITNDDPGFWDSKGLSYDFYYAIMSFAANNAGLKTLKHLVWSAIEYSALKEHEKCLAYEQLQCDWDVFLNEVLNGEII